MKPLDIVEALAFQRWVEYTKWSRFEGITWPEWREAYNMGVIR